MKEITKTKLTTQTSNSNGIQMQFNDIDPNFPRVDYDYDVNVSLREPIQTEFESMLDDLCLPKYDS
jgi:hypothetical protein